MLEQQQAQLVAGIRELYRRLRTGEGWSGAWLEESRVVDSSAIITDKTNKTNHPLTHDILERLDLLHVRSGEDGSPIYDNNGSTFLQQRFDGFDENCARLQQRLIREGASMVERRRNSQQQQKKKQQQGQDVSEAQHRRKRLRIDRSFPDGHSDDDSETDAAVNEHGQDEGEEDEEDGDMVGDEPALLDTHMITPQSTSASASPEIPTTKPLGREKRQVGQAQQPQILKFSNPFSEKSLPPTPQSIPTLQLTRSSSSGVDAGISNENIMGVNVQRHQSLPFLNQFQPFSDMLASPKHQENNFAAISAIKPHSPFHAGVNTAEAIRSSCSTSSAVTEAGSSLLSSERHCEISDRKSINTSADSLHHSISSAAATSRFGESGVTNTTTGNRLATGKLCIGNNRHQGSASALQSSLSPTVSLSTAQHSAPSPLTPLTPPISVMRSDSFDMMKSGTKSIINSSLAHTSVPISGASMTLTPSLIADLDNVDWQRDGQHGLDDYNGLNSVNNLDGVNTMNGFNGLTTLGITSVVGDTEMDFNRFIWA